MIKFLIISIAVLFQTGCALFIHREKIDENYTKNKTEYSRVYSHMLPQCEQGVRKAFSDLGTDVDEVKGKVFSSKRWEYSRQAQSYYSTYSGSSVAYTVTVKMDVMVEAGSKNECRVWVKRVRAWASTSEIEELGVTEVEERVVRPFFKNLDERLN